MKLSHWGVVGLSVLALLVSLFAIARPPVIEKIVEQLGAVTGPERNNSACYVDNGVPVCPGRKSLATATTTVCSFKSPAATSTLLYGSIQVTVSSTSAQYVEFGRGTTNTATTTRIGSINNYGANTQWSAVASTSDAGNLFSPNTYFNVNWAGGIGTFSPTGTCEAAFRVL